jgi:SecD/SecF fusion protein
VRKITDWTRRNLKDRDQGKEYEYFILVRDPLKGQAITGDYLLHASMGRTSRGGGPSIDFVFNHEGGKRFWHLTTRNKPEGPRVDGFNRQLAILFDNQIISAPSLNEPIRANGQITGSFTEKEVRDMVRLLRAGTLPARLQAEPVSEKMVPRER